MSRAVYLFDSNAKLLKKGSLTYDDVTLKYTFSATEAYITQGSIEVDELCIVVPDAMFTKANTGIFGSFVSPVRNPLGLVPGEWEARTIIDGATETTYLNCAIFALDLAFYTYVAGRYGFAIGFVDSTTGAIDKTPYDSYTVQNGVDNFTENNLTASDYDNLLTAITNLTSTIGGNVSQLLSDVATLKATVIELEADKHEFSALVGGTGETVDKDTRVYSKLKSDETFETKADLVGGNNFEGNQVINGTINAVGIVVQNASITSQLNKNNTKIVNLAKGVNSKDGANMENIADIESDVDDLETEIGNIKDGTTIVKKAEQDANGNNIANTYETKNDATSKLLTKVDKTQKIIGIDLQDDILLTEFKTALGNATQSVAGLLSAEDKTHLDGLVALLESSDGNTVVDTIGEILAIFQNYPEGTDLVTALNGKVDKEAGKGLSQNDFTDIDKNKVNLSYTHSEIVDGSNPHNTKFVNIADKPTTRDGYGITDVYTKPETYTKLEINNLLDNLSAVKGLKSTLLTPAELSNGDTISTNLLTNNGAFVVFTATDTSTEEIDSDTVPVSTIITGKKFVFFDNQEIVFTIGEINSIFETSEDITLKINLLYLDSENVQAVGVEFDGSLTNYLENQENVQSAINKLDEELKTTNDNSSNKVDKVTDKGLSTNDLTDDLKSNYDDAYTHSQTTHAPSNAEQNVQSDWNQTVNTEDDFIKNKPAIPTKTSDLTNDSGFATETYVNNKVSAVYKPQGSVLFSSLVVGLLIEANSGFVYNITDAFTTNENFVEGAGKSHSAGTNVVIIEHSGNYKFDVLGGTVDLTPYELLSNKVTSWSSTTNDTRYPSEKLVKDSLDDKVDKVTDKGLSTEDYTTTEKSKLAGLTVNIPVETWSTATKALTLSDANKLFVCSGAENQEITIPTNGTVPFPIGRMISFLLTSTYTVTFSGATGVTLTSMDGLVELATQYAMASLIKIDTDTWQLVGALE